jgi:hypothetical protein
MVSGSTIHASTLRPSTVMLSLSKHAQDGSWPQHDYAQWQLNTIYKILKQLLMAFYALVQEQIPLKTYYT